MNRFTTLFAVALLTITNLNAQKEIDSLSYENTQDIDFFKEIENGSLVKKYKTINKN